MGSNPKSQFQMGSNPKSQFQMVLHAPYSECSRYEKWLILLLTWATYWWEKYTSPTTFVYLRLQLERLWWIDTGKLHSTLVYQNPNFNFQECQNPNFTVALLKSKFQQGWNPKSQFQMSGISESQIALHTPTNINICLNVNMKSLQVQFSYEVSYEITRWLLPANCLIL